MSDFLPVTIKDVNDEIVFEQYYRFPETNHTVCCLKLKNGFTVIGENACTDAAKFDRDLAKEYSKEKALDKVWMLLGFRLQDKIHNQ
jgi:hypothetical protein